MHVRRTLFKENALSEPKFTGLEDDVFWTYNHTIRRYESTKQLIPPGRLHEIRFEDLEADPLREMRQLYQTISLPGWDDAQTAVAAEVPRLTAYKKNSFSLDADTMNRVFHNCRFAFDTYGYASGFDS